LNFIGWQRNRCERHVRTIGAELLFLAILPIKQTIFNYECASLSLLTQPAYNETTLNNTGLQIKKTETCTLRVNDGPKVIH